MDEILSRLLPLRHGLLQPGAMGMVTGTSGPDRLIGSAGGDRIDAVDGDDTVSGSSGIDVILLGLGNDVYGRTDRVSGIEVEEKGDDSVDGGNGNDILDDWRGANTLLGGQGSDSLDGAALAATDTTSDILQGGSGSDTLLGDYGDTLTGGVAAADTFMILPGGRPVVIADAQSANQAGPAADQIILLLPDNANLDPSLLFHFGKGPAPADSALMLGNSTAAILPGESGQFPSVTVSPTSQRMPGWGGDTADTLGGTSGDDFLFGGNGNDSLSAGKANDFVNDGWGNDWVGLGAGDDYMLGGDHLSGLSDNDDVHGGAGNDFIQSALGADTVHGDDGHDWLDVTDLPGQAGATADSVSGGLGNDTILADAGDTLTGNDGCDSFVIFGTGPVVIKDFAPGTDSVILAVPDFDAITAEQAANGADVLIEVNGTLMVTLRHVDLADIHLDNGMIF